MGANLARIIVVVNGRHTRYLQILHKYNVSNLEREEFRKSFACLIIPYGLRILSSNWKANDVELQCLRFPALIQLRLYIVRPLLETPLNARSQLVQPFSSKISAVLPTRAYLTNYRMGCSKLSVSWDDSVNQRLSKGFCTPNIIDAYHQCNRFIAVQGCNCYCRSVKLSRRFSTLATDISAPKVDKANFFQLILNLINFRRILETCRRCVKMSWWSHDTHGITK